MNSCTCAFVDEMNDTESDSPFACKKSQMQFVASLCLHDAHACKGGSDSAGESEFGITPAKTTSEERGSLKVA